MVDECSIEDKIRLFAYVRNRTINGDPVEGFNRVETGNWFDLKGYHFWSGQLYIEFCFVCMPLVTIDSPSNYTFPVTNEGELLIGFAICWGARIASTIVVA